MWKAGVRCSECGEIHLICTDATAAPRAFTFECPEKKTTVSVRVRDPSILVNAWEQVDEPGRWSIPTKTTESRGHFE